MDFGHLISVAQKNEHRTERKNFYPAKLAPPKRETKQSNKCLSENVRKFIAKKEEEERRKALDAQRKKENLLALRDQKTQNRINKHLKVCKAANKSVLDDAVDTENTAVTIAGPSQCDEDDYGYVSQEASVFYNKLMNKYSSLPPEKPLFSNDGKKVIKDIASTKDRVKEALRQQQLEESLPHKRKRKRKDSETDGQRHRDTEPNDDEDDTKKHSDEQESESRDKPRPKKRPMPPPMDFKQLLQIAEKKQYEPVKIEVKPKEEPERLMTKKQMKEYSKEKEWRERKEQRLRNPESAKPSQSSVDGNKTSKSPLPSKPDNMKGSSDRNNEKTDIRKLPTISKKSVDRPPEKMSTISKSVDRNNGVNKVVDRNNSSVRSHDRNDSVNRSADRNTSRPLEKSNGIHSKTSSVKALERDAIAEERRKLEEERRKFEEMRRSFEEEKKKLLMMKNKKAEDSRSTQSSSQKSTTSKDPDRPRSSSSSSSFSSKQSNSNSTKPKLNSSEVKSRPFPPADVKPRQFPPADVRPRQFPPPDVRSSKSKSKLKIDPHRRRIYDDSDEEYDSELDDFIDDGPQDEGEDYSKYISEIFGYDKSKYRDMDDDDDLTMESNFREVLKEEFESAKQGMMEDLEDMRLEKLQNKKKKLAMLKGKRRN